MKEKKHCSKHLRELLVAEKQYALPCKLTPEQSTESILQVGLNGFLTV